MLPLSLLPAWDMDVMIDVQRPPRDQEGTGMRSQACVLSVVKEKGEETLGPGAAESARTASP